MSRFLSKVRHYSVLASLNNRQSIVVQSLMTNRSMINAHIKTAYPQALSKLQSILGDIESAEDCLQSAVEAALKSWKESIPDNPPAWLIKVARNRFIDETRRRSKQQDFENLPEANFEPDLSEQALLLSYNDDLLRLIFTSCHPALNPETQISLALKHVLGLSVEQIANALVVPTKTLQQRLVRAKKKIVANQIRYEVPPPEKWRERLNGVLKTIYLLFNEGYYTTHQRELVETRLCQEAIRLCRMLHQCVRGDAEVIGLLALMLQQDARIPARTDKSGRLILLPDQDRGLWKQKNIQEANQLVEKSLLIGKGTPYAIQAAIASLHNNATTHCQTDWRQIFGLYKELLKIDDNPIVKLNAAIAQAQCDDRESAIEIVKLLAPELTHYRHYYTALAGLYFDSNDFLESIKHYKLALEKAESTPETEFIQSRILSCENALKAG